MVTRFLFLMSFYGVMGFSLLACQNEVGFGVDQQSEKFNQKIAYNNKVDFLWIIDNSSSMTDKQNKLSEQLPGMLAVLDDLKLDYHMAFITTDIRDKVLPTDDVGNGGQFIGSPKFLGSDTPNLLAEIQKRIIQGSTGSPLERGLMSLERAFSPNYLATDGKGFLRSEALLVINVLSDENDKSNKASSYYLDFLNKTKPLGAGQPGGWLLNYIGVLDLKGNCSSNGYPDPGYIFMDLASWSGGKSENICSQSLIEAVSSIRERIEQILTDYPLSTVPNPASIVVNINGVKVEESSVNGWKYISDINVIRFYGTAVPAADADILVDYDPAGSR